MSRARLLFTVIAMTTASHLSAQGTTAARSDSARLQGSWKMVAGAASGTPLDPASVSAMKRALSGKNLTVTMSGQLYFSATIVLDPAKSPRTIDYQMTGGPTTGAVQRGIYIFSGDTVRFCFAAPNAARPTEFKTVAGDGNTLSSWVPVR